MLFFFNSCMIEETKISCKSKIKDDQRSPLMNNLIYERVFKKNILLNKRLDDLYVKKLKYKLKFKIFI